MIRVLNRLTIATTCSRAGLLSAALALAMTSGLGLSAGCSSSSIGSRLGLASGDIRVINKTDRLIRVELVRIDRDNNPKIYSTQILAMDAEFTHGSSQEQRLPGMRARFSLLQKAEGLDVASEDVNVVQLGVPADESREYELRIVNGRLTAREIDADARRR